MEGPPFSDSPLARRAADDERVTWRTTCVAPPLSLDCGSDVSESFFGGDCNLTTRLVEFSEA